MLKDKNGLTEEEFLKAYKPGDYNRPSVTADIVILQRNVLKKVLKVLLIERGGHPYLGKWAFPGGFSNEDESVDETALRELEEETKITGLPLEQLKVMSKPGRDPRMWVIDVAYLTVIDSEVIAEASDDASKALWFDVDYMFDGTILSFELKHNDIELSATLTAKKKKGVGHYYYEFSQLESDLAFDHAEILAYAISKLN